MAPRQKRAKKPKNKTPTKTDHENWEELTEISEQENPDKFCGYESEGSHEFEDEMVVELYPTEEAFTEACIHEDDMELPESEAIGRKKDMESPAQQILRMIPRKQAGPPHEEISLDSKSPYLRGRKHVPRKNFAADATSIIDTIDTTYLYARLTLHHSLPRSGTQSA